MTRSGLTTAFVASVLLLAGCASSKDEPSGSDGGWAAYVPLTAPASLSELSRSHRQLDVEALSEDALDQQALAGVLEGAGFEHGAEIEFTGRTKLYNHVVARTLAFAKADGASAYLRWLDRNASDVIGQVKSRKPLSLGSDGVLLFEQGCGCHSDLPTFLAVWRDGALVRTLLADGPGANASRVTALARELR